MNFLALAVVQSRANFTEQQLHAADCEVQLDRDGHAQVFEHLIALGWLVFQKKLIDDCRPVGMFPQLGNGLLKIFSPKQSLDPNLAKERILRLCNLVPPPRTMRQPSPL